MTDRRTGTASVSVVFSGDLNVIEAGPMVFEFTQPTITNQLCTFQLGPTSSLAETFPFHKYRPATHPGLFDNAV